MVQKFIQYFFMKMVHFHKKIQNVVVPKERQRFLQILTKKSLGLVLFSRDRRVTPNIHCFLASSINSTPDHSNKNNLEATSKLREKYSNTQFFWSVFSSIRTKYPYSVQILENTDHKNSVFGYVDMFKNIKRNLETYISGSLKDILH